MRNFGKFRYAKFRDDENPPAARSFWQHRDRPELTIQGRYPDPILHNRQKFRESRRLPVSGTSVATPRISVGLADGPLRRFRFLPGKLANSPEFAVRMTAPRYYVMRLAMLFLLLAALVGLFGLLGFAGEFAWLARAGFLGLLVMFIISAAASAWQSQSPK